MSERIPSTLAVMKERMRRGSQPGYRDDGYKVGFMAESGGKRGVVGGGGTTALQVLGLIDVIDAAYGVSCGSCAANYLLTGQGPEGTSIYYTKINNDRFNDMRRIMTPEPVLNMRFLTHEVMFLDPEVKLNSDLILDSPIPVNVYATDALSLETVKLPTPKRPIDVLDNMLITCRIPGLAGSPLLYHDRYLTDGAILVGGMPVQQAIDDGCTHLLVMRSRREEGVTPFERLGELLVTSWIAENMRQNGYEALSKAMFEINNKQRENLNLLAKLKRNMDGIPQVEVVELPIGTTSILILEKRQAILRQGAIDGFKAMYCVFEPWIKEGLLTPNELVKLL